MGVRPGAAGTAEPPEAGGHGTRNLVSVPRDRSLLRGHRCAPTLAADHRPRSRSMLISPRPALERAVDLALLAPSVRDAQPWLLELRSDLLLLRADRSRQLTAMDPTGRKLVRSVGAALFDARVALAADGWGADVGRLPDPADPDLLAVVRPVAGEPDRELAALAPAVPRR